MSTTRRSHAWRGPRTVSKLSRWSKRWLSFSTLSIQQLSGKNSSVKAWSKSQLRDKLKMRSNSSNTRSTHTWSSFASCQLSLYLIELCSTKLVRSSLKVSSTPIRRSLSMAFKMCQSFFLSTTSHFLTLAISKIGLDVKSSKSQYIAWEKEWKPAKLKV